MRRKSINSKCLRRKSRRARRLRGERLEPRLCLSAFYEIDRVASSGGGFIQFGDHVSINDKGDIGFVALRLEDPVSEPFLGLENEGNELWLAQRQDNSVVQFNPEFDRIPFWNSGNSVALNNSNQMAARDRVFLPSQVFNRFRIWEYDAATGTGSDRRISDGGSGYLADADINEQGDVVFVSANAGQRIIHFNSRALGGVPVGGPIPRPQVANDGTVLTHRWDAGSEGEVLNQRIVIDDTQGVGGRTVIASEDDGFTALGNAPGISDDGRVVVFSAEQAGTHTIHAAINTSEGWQAFPIIGEEQGFRGQWLDLTDAIRVNSTLDEQRAVTIVWEGTHQDLGRGVYSARLNFFGNSVSDFDPDNLQLEHPDGGPSYLVNRIVPVATVGEQIGSSIIEEVEIWDAVNNRDGGDIAFWAETSAGQSIFRAVPYHPIWVEFDAADADFSYREGLNFDLLDEVGVADLGFSGNTEQALAAAGFGVNFFDTFQDEVVDQVAGILEDSFANINVLGRSSDVKPPTLFSGQDRFPTVYVGGVPGGLPDPLPDEILTGLASAVPNLAGGEVDLFNQFHEDLAVVFADLQAVAQVDSLNLDNANLKNALSFVIAHEIGHFFGLQHELRDLDLFDPNPDQFLMDETADQDQPVSLGVLSAPLEPRSFTVGGVTRTTEGLRQSVREHLQFAAGAEFASSGMPPSDELLEFLDAEVQARLRLSSTNNDVEGETGDGLLNRDVQVTRLLVGYFAGRDLLPRFVDLGSGDLATLLRQARLTAPPGSQFILIGSTTGAAPDIIGVGAGHSGAENDLNLSFAGLLDPRLRAEMEGSGANAILSLFEMTPVGPFELGLVATETVPPVGEIRGTKWWDQDGNGERSFGEEGLEGWTIFVDLNENEVLDSGEPFDVTDRDGEYAITGLPRGAYTLDEVQQAGWQQSFPTILTTTYHPTQLQNTIASRIQSGDLDGDLDTDFLVVQDFEQVIAYLNDGSGSFSEPQNLIPLTQNLSDFGLADFNGDQQLDLITVARDDRIIGTDSFENEVVGILGRVNVYLNQDGVFQLASSLETEFGEELVVGRFDDNDSVDFAMLGTRPALEEDDTVSSQRVIGLYFNDGAGAFSFETSVAVDRFLQHLVVGDFDDDNDQDLAAIQSGPLFEVAPVGITLFLNDGDGALESPLLVELPEVPSFIRVVDPIGNDDDELLYGAHRNVNLLSLGQTLIPETQELLGLDFTPQDGLAVDLNSNGNLDLVLLPVPSASDRAVRVFEGVGNFTFEETERLPYSVVQTRLHAAHLNDDADLDLAFGQRDARSDIDVTDYFTVLLKGEPQQFRQRHQIQLRDDEVLTSVDLGNELVKSEIRGMKWFDVNGDGFRQSDEPPLEGWTIFLDSNGNTLLDDGELSVMTDEEGHYAFLALEPGEYEVAEVMQPDWQQTSPSNLTHLVFVDAGERAVELNFGNQFTGPLGRIEGFTWEDKNGDGTRDPEDTGLSGWTVYLDQNNNGALDALEPTSVTDADGAYAFADLPPLPATVRQVVQLGWQQTFPNNGRHAVDVRPGETHRGDFGNEFAFPELLGVIRGSAWEDENGDGVRDPNEAGLEGAVIYLDENRNGQRDSGELSATTDAGGNYAIELVPPGHHLVAEDVGAGFELTFPGLSQGWTALSSTILAPGAARVQPWGGTVGDLNGDNLPDLVTSINGGVGGTDGVAVRLNLGQGQFSEPMGSFLPLDGMDPGSTVLGHFNADTHLDLAVATYDAFESRISIALGNGDGTFQVPVDFSSDFDPFAGLTAAHLNDDEHLDLIAMSSSGLKVLLNSGLADFSNEMDVEHTLAQTDLVVGDFNGDDHQDVAVAHEEDIDFAEEMGVTLFLGNGTGNLEPGTSIFSGSLPFTELATRLALGDWNNDGALDLAVSAERAVIDDDGGQAVLPGEVTVLQNDGTGQFLVASVHSPVQQPDDISVGDFDGDGSDDLAVSDRSNRAIAVLTNAGAGSFRVSFESDLPFAPQTIFATDFQQDGSVDLGMIDDRRAFTLLPNLGAGRFPLASQTLLSEDSDRPEDLFVMDVDNDGDTDGILLLESGEERFSILQNEGPSQFLPRALTNGFGLVVPGDFNGDGILDAVHEQLQASGSRLETLIGDGTSTLSDPQGADAELDFFNELRAVDIDGDSDLDVVAVEHQIDDLAPEVYVVLNDGSGGLTRVEGAVLNERLRGSELVVDLDNNRHYDRVAVDVDNAQLVVELNRGRAGGANAQSIALSVHPIFAAAGDLNGDEVVDLVVVGDFTSGNLSVLLGNGDGTFADEVLIPAGLEPLAVDLADLNGDQRLDIVTADNIRNEVIVLLGNGDGSFEDGGRFPVGFGPAGLAVGDFNNDQNPDVATQNAGSFDVSVLLGNGDGTFAEELRSAVESGAEAGHYNGDDHLDFGRALGNGDGTFSGRIDLFEVLATRPALADLNGDGRPDLVQPDPARRQLLISQNIGDGVFESASTVSLTERPRGIYPGDLNGDGLTDLVVAYLDADHVTILFGGNDASLTVGPTLEVGHRPIELLIADLDQNGSDDLALADSAAEVVTLITSTGDGSFAVPTTVHVAGLEQIAAEDMNGDGNIDLVAGQDLGAALFTVLYNGTSPSLRHEVAVTSGSQADNINFGGRHIGPPWQNPVNRFDVNNDTEITPNDVLRLINEVNDPVYSDASGVLPMPSTVVPPPYLDPSGDNLITPVADILPIINLLNLMSEGEAEAEAEMLPAAHVLYVSLLSGSSLRFVVTAGPEREATALPDQVAARTTEGFPSRPSGSPAGRHGSQHDCCHPVSRKAAESGASALFLEGLEDVLGVIGEDVCRVGISAVPRGRGR